MGATPRHDDRRDRPRFPNQGGSWLGGSEELDESRFSRRSSFANRMA